MQRVDWPMVLGDLAHVLGEPTIDGRGRVPCTQEQLAKALDVARGTLRGWLDGSEPKHADGEALLLRWCQLTGKDRGFAPKERRSLSAHAR
jgi:transcriptional regulator with XRE-family HTH domain